MGARARVARPRWCAGFGALALVFVGACSDDAASNSTSGSSPLTTQVDSTTTATTSSSAPSITSTTSTALPTPTTAGPAAAADSDVRAAIDLAQSSFSDCLTAMPTCDHRRWQLLALVAFWSGTQRGSRSGTPLDTR